MPGKTSKDEAEIELTPEEKEAKEEEIANQEATKAQGEEEPPSSESAPDQTSQQPKEEEAEDLTEEEQSQLSAKAQKRFKALSEKAKKAGELEKRVVQLEKLRQPQAPTIPQTLQTPKPPTQTPGQAPTGKLPWETEGAEEGSEELTVEQLDERNRKIVQEELQKEKTAAQVKSDVVLAEEKYPELNPDKPDTYNEGLANQIADWYKAMFQVNQNLSLIDFVNQIMSLRGEGAEQGKAEVTKNMAQQAAEQAVAPSGAPSKDGPTQEDRIKNAKSEEELDELERTLPHAD